MNAHDINKHVKITPLDVYKQNYTISDDYEVIDFRAPKYNEIYLSDLGGIYIAYNSFSNNQPRFILKKIEKVNIERYVIKAKDYYPGEIILPKGYRITGYGVPGNGEEYLDYPDICEDNETVTVFINESSSKDNASPVYHNRLIVVKDR